MLGKHLRTFSVVGLLVGVRNWVFLVCFSGGGVLRKIKEIFIYRKIIKNGNAGSMMLRSVISHEYELLCIHALLYRLIKTIGRGNLHVHFYY